MKKKKNQHVTETSSVLKVVRILHHDNRKTIPLMCSQNNDKKSQIYLVSLGKSSANIWKISRAKFGAIPSKHAQPHSRVQIDIENDRLLDSYIVF